MPEELQIEIISALIAAVTAIVGGGYFANLSWKWRLIAGLAEAVVAKVGREYVSKIKEKNLEETGHYDLNANEETIAFNTATTLIHKKAPDSLKPLIEKHQPKVEALIQEAVRKNKAVQKGRNTRSKGM